MTIDQLDSIQAQKEMKAIDALQGRLKALQQLRADRLASPGLQNRGVDVHMIDFLGRALMEEAEKQLIPGISYHPPEEPTQLVLHQEEPRRVWQMLIANHMARFQIGKLMDNDRQADLAVRELLDALREDDTFTGIPAFVTMSQIELDLMESGTIAPEHMLCGPSAFFKETLDKRRTLGSTPYTDPMTVTTTSES